MEFQSVSQIKEAGFCGFVTVESLFNFGYASIPEEGGVYMILRRSVSKPVFLSKGTGGYFKEKEPNVDIDVLKANWVEGTCVMYIGKATSLKKRISQYIRFGHGANVGHYGGRFIWQLADSKDLFVCWKPSRINPRTEESALIQEFIGHYGERPFANLQD